MTQLFHFLSESTTSHLSTTRIIPNIVGQSIFENSQQLLLSQLIVVQNSLK